jgi:serine protease Do
MNPIYLILTTLLLMSCAPKMLPRPFGEIERPTVVEYLLRDNIAPIEGLWIWPDSRYEIAILAASYGAGGATIRTPGTNQYDFVGVVAETMVPGWHRGELKVLLKKTADSTLYVGVLVMGDKTTTSVTARIRSTNVLEIDPQGTYYERLTSYERHKLSLLRTYPVSVSDTLGSKDGDRLAPGTLITATGFLVCPGVIATNQHVIAGWKRIQVFFEGKAPVSATPIMKDDANDLALLRLDLQTENEDFLPIGSGQLKEGDPVITIGYPMPGDLGRRPKLGDGIVSSIGGLEDDPRILQVTVPVHPGNSGGPLIGNTGEVVGVITARLRDEYALAQHGVIPQNVNFAVKSSYLAALMSMVPECSKCQRLPVSSSLSPSELMEQSRAHVAYIEVER